MGNTETARAHVCDLCRERAVVFLVEGGMETLLCARHLTISDPPAGRAFATLASSAHRMG